MEIRRVSTQVSTQQVEEGFFTFDGHTLRQVTEDGHPVRARDGSSVERAVDEKDDPERAARQILRDGLSDFDRPINYGEQNGWR